MASRPKNKKTSKINNAIDDIWKNLGIGLIDISYACVGYTMDGRPVLNQDELVNLLIASGYPLDAVITFISEFADQSTKNTKAPIVMYSVNTAKIMTDIKPIVGNK